eukprot:gene34443-biopygen30071
MGTGTPKTSRFAGVSGAQARHELVEIGDGLRWLNEFCVKSKCKMETLKKLRRLASRGDWCFTFDLKDGMVQQASTVQVKIRLAAQYGAAGTPGEIVSPPAPSLEMQLLLQQMTHQQEAQDAAMKIQQAESKQHDLQAQLLTEQISALRADAEKA